MADGNYNRNNNSPVRKERPKHALNDFRFRIQGERLDGATRPCAIGLDVTGDGIEFTAYSQVEGDEDYGKIRVAVSTQEAFAVTVLLEKALRLNPGQSQLVAIAGKVWDKNTNKSVQRHAANLTIGRDEQGVIYLKMEHWKTSRPKVTCRLLPSNFFKLVDAETGQPAPADKVSEIMALSWAKALTQMIPIVLNAEYLRVNAAYFEKQAQRRQQGGGGYPQGGGYQGGGQPAAQPSGTTGGADSASYGGFGFDDDLPM